MAVLKENWARVDPFLSHIIQVRIACTSMCRVVGRAEARVKHPFRNRYFLQYADILNVRFRSPRPLVTLFHTVPRQRGIQLALEACYQENKYSLPVYLEISHKTRHYLLLACAQGQMLPHLRPGSFPFFKKKKILPHFTSRCNQLVRIHWEYTNCSFATRLHSLIFIIELKCLWHLTKPHLLQLILF
jgi:hypothetical protein